MPLTLMQQAFVDAYLSNGGNAAQAAVAAGYSARSARGKGSQLLELPDVQRAIGKARKRAELRTGVTMDRVRLELARVAFGDVRNVATWGSDGVRSSFTLRPSDELDDDEAAPITEIKVKRTFRPGADPDGPPDEVEEASVKLADKVKALELLGKHLGMFETKIRHVFDGELDLSKLTADQVVELERLLAAAAAGADDAET